jgi:hypothetical protein
MLVGEAFVRVDGQPFRNELAALAVPSVIGTFLTGEDSAAGRTEQLSQVICVMVVHAHNSIIFCLPLLSLHDLIGESVQA